MVNYINKAAWQDALLKEEILAEVGEGGGPVAAVDVTADAVEDGTATDVQGILEELAARIKALEIAAE